MQRIFEVLQDFTLTVDGAGVIVRTDGLNPGGYDVIGQYQSGQKYRITPPITEAIAQAVTDEYVEEMPLAS